MYWMGWLQGAIIEKRVEKYRLAGGRQTSRFGKKDGRL